MSRRAKRVCVPSACRWDMEIVPEGLLEIRHVVRATLTHHIADGGPHVRIVDRLQALLDNRLQC
ncbi:hypothetical protein GCM10010207_84730 [Streptomyces atratus]|nr:hypothetical protein GCM10010207_84730 [Streptomyces atratus]